MFLPASLGRQRCEIRLEQTTRFKKLGGVETMECAEDPVGRLAYQRRRIGDKRADTMTDFHNPLGCEIPNSRSQTRSANSQGLGELALRRKFVAGLK
jgi:hypothetical protein